MTNHNRMRGVVRWTLIVTLAATVAGCGFFHRKKDTRFSDGSAIAITGEPLRVNAFLWRASLETLTFMPLAATDSSGGLILTDWYSPPDVADERVKVNVQIMDLRLRADALRVSVFRQIRLESGEWADRTVKAGTAQRIEDAILTRARQLRIRSVTAG